MIWKGLMKTSTWENVTPFQFNLDDDTWIPNKNNPSSSYHGQHASQIISDNFETSFPIPTGG